MRRATWSARRRVVRGATTGAKTRRLLVRECATTTASLPGSVHGRRARTPRAGVVAGRCQRHGANVAIAVVAFVTIVVAHGIRGPALFVVRRVRASRRRSTAEATGNGRGAGACATPSAVARIGGIARPLRWRARATSNSDARVAARCEADCGGARAPGRTRGWRRSTAAGGRRTEPCSLGVAGASNVAATTEGIDVVARCTRRPRPTAASNRRRRSSAISASLRPRRVHSPSASVVRRSGDAQCGSGGSHCSGARDVDACHGAGAAHGGGKVRMLTARGGGPL